MQANGLSEEALVRLAVRRAIRESIEDDADLVAARAAIRGKRKNAMMTDVEGDHLKKIAADLGFSVSGAKQAVDKALKKATFLASMDDADRDLMVLEAVKDYISMLEKTIDDSDPDAPTVDDIQLMYDHPMIVAEMPGFREFLHKHVKRAAKAANKRIS